MKRIVAPFEPPELSSAAYEPAQCHASRTNIGPKFGSSSMIATISSFTLAHSAGSDEPPECVSNNDCDCTYSAAAVCVGASDVASCEECAGTCYEDNCAGGEDDDGYAMCLTQSACNQ